jgi:2,4-dienoyl-CoA reductase-like NADH-dependent reductase (Old Yellow Enzyme family)
MGDYKSLFKPLKVGSIILRNRIVAAPITKYGFFPSPVDELEVIAAKARGGAALVILGSCGIDEDESLIHPTASGLDGYRLSLFNEELSVIHQ